MTEELQVIMREIAKNLSKRSQRIDEMIKLKHFPSPIMYYAVAIMVINNYKLHHIWKCSYIWDEKKQLWINVKFRNPNTHDSQSMVTIGQAAVRRIHGTTPRGFCGIIRNSAQNRKGSILPQMGSLSSKKTLPLKFRLN